MQNIRNIFKRKISSSSESSQILGSSENKIEEFVVDFIRSFLLEIVQTLEKDKFEELLFEDLIYLNNNTTDNLEINIDTVERLKNSDLLFKGRIRSGLITLEFDILYNSGYVGQFSFKKKSEGINRSFEAIQFWIVNKREQFPASIDIGGKKFMVKEAGTMHSMEEQKYIYAAELTLGIAKKNLS